MSTKALTLLIADDDRLTRDAYKAAAERHGYDVLLAEDGEAVMTIVASNPVDVVLLDILMPKKEGLETLIDLKRQRPALYIIAMSAGSGRSKHDFLSIAAKFGADATLRKPFTPQALFDLVEGRANLVRAAEQR